MSNWDSITQQRWFMGKGRKVNSIKEYDTLPTGDTKISIVEVCFDKDENDFYAVIEDECKIGSVLAEYFGKKLPKEALIRAKPLNAEQSNSAFYSKGEFFFKLYRRLQVGEHPEAEIMEHLSQKTAQGFPKIAPEFYGDFSYTKSGETRTLGILEEHIPDARNAWEIFTDVQNGDAEFYKSAARQLGRTTATMHKALKDLEGTAPQAEEVPYDKLIRLLKANGREDLVERVECIKLQQGQEITKSNVLTPQRIHGDYHLGQLLYKDGKFIVLDFEGEPTRTLEYRRRLRSPAADIAGMLRSFAYASAVRNDKDFEQTAAEAFLLGYSEESGIPVAQLKEEASPYVLGKAIYEACYELEFRPSWFWIPEKLLV
ncbi:phosphotransferase [Fibrobacter sp.]|uniref:phosphotransferase n=1 Tax=Fibrobacter sp. TaxID=35828 RepID=UPI003866F081